MQVRNRGTAEASMPAPCKEFKKEDSSLKGVEVMRIRIGKELCRKVVIAVVTTIGLFLVSGAGSRANAQTQPAIITFDAPGAGTSNGQGTWATAINAGGVIAGFFVDSTFACHGFVRNPDGTFVTFDTPVSPLGAPTCPQPASVNAAGAIAGVDVDPSFGCISWSQSDQNPPGCGGNHGFIRTANGMIIVFDGPVNPSFSNPGTFPTSISSTKAVVGSYDICDQGVCSTSFLRDPEGNFSTFDPPGKDPGLTAGAVGINAIGTIAGVFTDSNFIVHGYLRARNGTFTIVDVPGPGGFGFTSIAGINSSGKVTGLFVDANSALHSYVRGPAGTFTTFDVPGGVSTRSQSINDGGTTVGTYVTFGPFGEHIFVRTADGTFTTFDAPSQSFVLGSGISSSNAVVGNYQDANFVTHSFLRPGSN